MTEDEEAMIGLVENQLLNALAEWKARLGLADWKIKARFNCKPDDMSIDPYEAGCVSFVESKKVALIEIVDPSCIGNSVFHIDEEQVLVHELLHLKFSLLCELNGEESLQSRIVHQIIDDLARALVEVKRGAQNKGGNEKNGLVRGEGGVGGLSS